MFLLQILGFVLPSVFFIILFFLADKKGSYLPILLNMFILPIGIIYNTLHQFVSGPEYAVYAMFIVYMMANLYGYNTTIKIFSIITTTCAVLVAGLDFYTRYSKHLLNF